MLALEDAVDWHSGDEVLIVSSTGVGGASLREEIVIVETVHHADLHLRAPLRYTLSVWLSYKEEDKI